jgi:hypothetical protein
MSMKETDSSNSWVWPRTTIRQRYMTDGNFATVVNTMLAMIARAEFTPTEIREAAMLAQILYEERNPRPISFTKSDLLKGKV